jgi:hypothetical protein
LSEYAGVGFTYTYNVANAPISKTITISIKNLCETLDIKPGDVAHYGLAASFEHRDATTLKTSTSYTLQNSESATSFGEFSSILKDNKDHLGIVRCNNTIGESGTLNGRDVSNYTYHTTFPDYKNILIFPDFNNTNATERYFFKGKNNNTTTSI